jgi:hypothetical protein
MISHKGSIESEDFPPDQTGSTVSALDQRGPQRRWKLQVLASEAESPRV